MFNFKYRLLFIHVIVFTSAPYACCSQDHYCILLRMHRGLTTYKMYSKVCVQLRVGAACSCVVISLPRLVSYLNLNDKRSSTCGIHWQWLGSDKKNCPTQWWGVRSALWRDNVKVVLLWRSFHLCLDQYFFEIRRELSYMWGERRVWGAPSGIARGCSGGSSNPLCSGYYILVLWLSLTLPNS